MGYLSAVRLWMLFAFSILLQCSVGSLEYRQQHQVFTTTEQARRCLGACACYDSVQTVNCSGKDYDYVPYGIPVETKLLDLSHNSLETIGPQDFQDLSATEILDLSNNKISRFGRQPFKNMSGLKVLKMSNNWLLLLRQYVMQGLENLEELDLSYGRVSGLNEGLFISMARLKILNVGFNLLTSSEVTNVTFEGLTSLQELDLSGTQLYEIPMYAMNPFKNGIKNLNMSYSSRLNVVGKPDSQKLDLPSLEVLDLSYSRISLIYPGSFSGLPNLKLLNMYANFLNILSPGTFFGMSSLQYLNLSGNAMFTFPYLPLQAVSESLIDLRLSRIVFERISNLTGNVSENYLSNLKSLIIEDGDLQNISGDSFFRSLRSLEYLRIANTQIQEMPTAALQHLQSLRKADFSGNPIKTLTKGDIPNLPSLRELLLSNGGLERFEGDVFSSVVLHTLRIDGNKLQNISADVFETLTNLTVLDISNNLLETPNSTWFSDKPLKEVRIANNPWNCDCTSQEFYKWMQTQEYQSIEYFDPVICDQPRKLKSYPLGLLTETDLTCDFGECSSQCICSGTSAVREPTSRKAITANQLVKKRDEGSKFSWTSSQQSTEYLRLQPLDDLSLSMPRYDHSLSMSTVSSDCTGSKLQEIPAVPDTTEYMSVAQNAIKSIRNGDLSYMLNLQAFIASDNQIRTIENSSFSGLHSLSILYLNKNDLTVLIPASWFANLSALQELRLDDNVISGISSLAFFDLKQLSILDLSKNQITSLQADSFAGLQSLKYLNLASNQISTIEETTFHGMPKLLYLYLNQNSLSQIPAQMIQPNFNMQYLDLSQNTLQTISKNFLISDSLELLKMESGYNPTLSNGSFGALPNIKILHLRSSFISTIENEAFDINSTGNTSRVQTLDLGNNYLKNIPLQAISKLSALETLSVSDNQFVELPVWNDEIPLLPNLKTLYLANTDIQNISVDSFVSHLTSLVALVINHCSLTEIPVHALASTNLQYFVLDENPITHIGDELSMLYQLRQIQFGDATSLESVSEGAFHNLTNLERLVLSNGKLPSIPNQSFKNLKNLEVLDLSNNKLTQPEPEWFWALDATKVKSILLYGNPWECDCEAEDYKVWVDSGAQGLSEHFVSVSCYSPQVNKGLLISETNITDLVCYTTRAEELTSAPITTSTLITTSVPTTTSAPIITSTITYAPGPDEDCQKCSYNETSKLGSCVGKRLRSVPRGCFPADVEKLELSSNLIAEIRSNDFEGLHALRILDISNNDIELISEEAFSHLHRLKSLDLSSNQLLEVPSAALYRIGTSLASLNLNYQQISRLNENAIDLPYLEELSMVAVRGSGLLPFTIDDFCFAKLSRLRKLDLSENAVASMGTNTFTGLHQLRQLSLASTRLSDFPQESMWRLSTLTELNLNYNSISKLGSSSVPILMSLEKFTIRQNSLAYISDDCFLNECVNITELDFGHSLLTQVPSYLLKGFKPKLEVLRFDHSQISSILAGDLPKSTRGLVDLSYSKLQSINPLSFADMKDLYRLNIASSGITSIAENAFANSGLKNLDLSYNELDYISCAWFDNLPYGQNVTMNLSGNKFHCTCGMVGYRDYMESLNYTANVYSVTGDVCASPEQFNGTEIGNVPTEDMESYCESENLIPSYCGYPPKNPNDEVTTNPPAISTTSHASRFIANSIVLLSSLMLTTRML